MPDSHANYFIFVLRLCVALFALLLFPHFVLSAPPLTPDEEAQLEAELDGTFDPCEGLSIRYNAFLIHDVEIIRKNIFLPVKSDSLPFTEADYKEMERKFAFQIQKIRRLIAKQSATSTNHSILSQTLVHLQTTFDLMIKNPTPASSEARRNKVVGTFTRFAGIFTEAQAALSFPGRTFSLRRYINGVEVDVHVEEADGDQVWLEVKSNSLTAFSPDLPIDPLSEIRDSREQDILRQTNALNALRTRLNLQFQVKIGIVFRHSISPDLQEKLEAAGADFIHILYPHS